jgi:hypothetical protein
MKPMALIEKLAWIFGAMGILLILVVLDWLPTVKDLNRIRREQRDEVLRIKNFTAMDSGFIFPDTEEKSLFAQNRTRLRRSLPKMYDNDAWLAMAMLELQAQVRLEGIANDRIYFSNHAIGTEFDWAGPGRPDELTDWLSLQHQDIQKSFQLTADPSRYPWYGVFSGLEVVRQQRLASCGLAVALAAPLPGLLNFINRISWGETRLEIVRLHLEPGAALSRAWLICRGNYLVREPSAWVVKMEPGNGGDDILIDPDSPMLWQKVDPLIAYRVEKKELPPPGGGPW